MAYNFSTFPNAIFICLPQIKRNPVSIDNEFDSDSTRASEGKRDGYTTRYNCSVSRIGDFAVALTFPHLASQSYHLSRYSHYGQFLV
jgi:hypothetical protein